MPKFSPKEYLDEKDDKVRAEQPVIEITTTETTPEKTGKTGDIVYVVPAAP